MDTSKLNNVMQIVGMFAIVASLIFVGLQINQTQEIALSNAYQARASQSIELVLAIADNQAAGAAFTKSIQGDFDSISLNEKHASAYVVYGVMFSWENAHYQFTQGFLSEERWLGTRNDIKGALEHPLWNTFVFDLWFNKMRLGFQDVLIQIAQELEEDSNGPTRSR